MHISHILKSLYFTVALSALQIIYKPPLFLTLCMYISIQTKKKGTNSINACMEAAKKAGGPIMVTFSKGGAQFICGKAADNSDDKASIAGAVAGALHVREVAKLYGVPVILHTDHCQKVCVNPLFSLSWP
jgi:hypothetical protein